MEKTNIENRIRAIIVEKFSCENEDVKLKSSFINDLGADSLDNVELIMEFEREFDIIIPNNDAGAIKTLEDAIDYVNKHRN